MEQEIIDLSGERCPDYEPLCVVCQTWEMWDLHAYGALREHLDEILNWMEEEAAYEQSLEYFNRYIAGDR